MSGLRERYGEIEQRTFDLFEPRVATRMRWFARRGWEPAELRAQIATAIADRDRKRHITLSRWKRLPLMGWRQPDGTYGAAH